MAKDPRIAERQSTRGWVADHRAIYLASGGAEGHIMDLRGVGGHAFGTHCLIRYRGRRSGKTFINALTYGAIGGEVVICASKGGADEPPQWYHNVLSSETIDYQIATQAYRAAWREPEGAERDKIWAFMVDCYPFYGVYQTRTARQLQLVMMKGFEPISVFRDEDAASIAQS
jgi:deazaflavin-dependent oxidoreductase (nitroreductase family)